MPHRAPRAPALNFDGVHELVRHLPGVERGTSYGSAAIEVRGKLLRRLQKDGWRAIAPKTLVTQHDAARARAGAPA